ncbi:MAG: DUF2807 domain-containing protein [Dysgonomonas sp.]|uniref:GIN domain-containing protein n=1 Tax=Dysgonomonas sp. TaxID=1891233 RepID=UPI0039E38C78
MIRKIIFLLFMVLNISSYSQVKFTKFSFSGYQVNVIPSNSFRIEIKNNIEHEKNVIEGNTLEYIINDQRGRVPKDTVDLYTDRIENLSLHNSELLMDNYEGDSLKIDLASSFAYINLDCKYLYIEAEAASSVKISGKVEKLSCVSGAASNINASKISAKNAIFETIGHGTIIYDKNRLDNYEEKINQ